MQTMYAVLNGALCRIELAPADTELLPGVRWGAFDELLTPAYWKGQAWQHERLGTYKDFRLGRSLGEELAACLLGGHGMPAELGLAAYRRLQERGLLGPIPTAAALEAALSEPFVTARGATRRYRFPRQKARYLAGCLEALQTIDPPGGDVALRNRLLELPGIGPKTASWIVRNHRGSDRVAIIDIHILRAGRHVGLFPIWWQPQRHYFQLEAAFLELAGALDVRASLLDALIWDYMRRLPHVPARHESGGAPSAPGKIESDSPGAPPSLAAEPGAYTPIGEDTERGAIRQAPVRAEAKTTRAAVERPATP